MTSKFLLHLHINFLKMKANAITIFIILITITSFAKEIKSVGINYYWN